MKHLVVKFAFAVLVIAAAICFTEGRAKADGFYYYAGPTFYAAPPMYYYAPPVYVAPAPIVSYGYVAGPPVIYAGGVQPAYYYYPETVGVATPYFPSKVTYKYRHGRIKVEIDD